MAKLSDGSSFRFYRMASNFRTIAASGTTATIDMIDSPEFRLWHTPGRTMVPPVFEGRMAYFYLSGVTSTSTSKLVAYRWNILRHTFEEKCSVDIGQEGLNTNNYHKYSLVNMGADGVIFNAFGVTTDFKLYLCEDTGGGYAYTTTIVTFDNAAGALTGP